MCTINHIRDERVQFSARVIVHEIYLSIHPNSVPISASDNNKGYQVTQENDR